MKNLSFIVIVLILISGCRIYNEYPRKFVNPKTSSQSYDFEIHLANLKNRVMNQDTFFLPDCMVTQVVGALDTPLPLLLDIEPERFYELVDVIHHEIKNGQLSASDRDSYHKKITILAYQEGSSLPWKLLTAFTMGVPCLVGMPANWTSTFVKIEISLMDESGNMISSVLASGYNKTWVAMYWGYGADARKRSNMMAMENALVNLEL